MPNVVAGAWREVPSGLCFVAERAYPLDHVHGGVALCDMLAVDGATLDLLGGSPSVGRFEPRRTAFLDIETTGLAGGTGTYAFLIGVGFFADGCFRIEQFFLQDPAGERAQLEALALRLATFETIVTFNGKCFDWPLIETRYGAARMPIPLVAPHHLDMLYPARRLFRRRLASCGLGSLELAVLGLPERVGDVPGWLIPTIYFDYLRRRDGRALGPVFEHNRRDILSMLALTIRLARHAAEPHDYWFDDSRDTFSLGCLLERAGRVADAIGCFERALLQAENARRRGARESTLVDHSEAHARLAAAYKRVRATDRAVAIWQSLIDDGARSTFPYIELAKHHEHGRRDVVAALALVEQAARRHAALRSVTPPSRFAVERADLDRRLARLRRKSGAVLATP